MASDRDAPADATPQDLSSSPLLTTTTVPPPAKSPPLAFAPTPNDALVAPISLQDQCKELSPAPAAVAASSSASDMGAQRSRSTVEMLQKIVDEQALAIEKWHEVFAQERRLWRLEKEALEQRISSLEKLLQTGSGYRQAHNSRQRRVPLLTRNSPARSPVMSPQVDHFTAPSFRHDTHSQRLPSIAEDDGVLSLSYRRESAPTFLQMPEAERPVTAKRHGSVVTFGESASQAQAAPVIVEDIPIALPGSAGKLSPPPESYRENAGHTPLEAPRPPTPPPGGTSGVEGIDDTPTRNNTQMNTFLAKATEVDEDPELKGPLNMPELPNMPGDTNFTMDQLRKKLQQIEKHPENNKPLVFSVASPGLASPKKEDASIDSHLSPKSGGGNTNEEPFAPAPTVMPDSKLTSRALSPTSVMSANGAPLSRVESRESRESQIAEEFAQGGIKLKKKTSVNFGAPLGQLGFLGSNKMGDLDSING